MKRKITFEVERRLVIGRNCQNRFCELCGDESDALSVDESVLIAQTDRETIQDWIKHGLLHVAKGPAGELLICSRSLAKAME